MYPTLTLTGLTHEDQITQAAALSDRFNFLEWGILYSPSRVGGRYAAHNWILNDSNVLRLPKKALHLCGKAVPMFLEANPQVTELLHPDVGIRRVQLNFNIVKTPLDLSLVSAAMHSFPHIDFITQHNNSNEDVYNQIWASNHQVLFDQSGGNGIGPKEWKKPLRNKLCGYAGGLGPDNIDVQLAMIYEQVQSRDFWIDMESNIRTDDELDFFKCEQVAKAVLFFTEHFL